MKNITEGQLDEIKICLDRNIRCLKTNWIPLFCPLNHIGNIMLIIKKYPGPVEQNIYLNAGYIIYIIFMYTLQYTKIVPNTIQNRPSTNSDTCILYIIV